MASTIAVDPALLLEALRASGAKTESEAVDMALRLLVRLSKQAKIRDFRGRLNWQGDLNKMREGG